MYSPRESTISTIPLYHYTDSDGAEGIKRSQIIIRSEGLESDIGHDAHYGVGVYLSDYDPFHNDPQAIGESLFDGSWQRKTAHVEHCVRIVFDTSEVRLVDRERRVWLYPEFDIDLAGRQWTLIENATKSVVLFYYTTASEAEEIQMTGVIRASKSGGSDANHGVGVYLTDLSASAAPKLIAPFVYRDSTTFWWSRQLCDKVIKVKIPFNDVSLVDEKRRVWLYRNHLCLHNVMPS